MSFNESSIKRLKCSSCSYDRNLELYFDIGKEIRCPKCYGKAIVMEFKDDNNVAHACPSCSFESNNEEDFSYVEGDTLHYCDKCIKKNNLIKRDVKNVGGESQ